MLIVMFMYAYCYVYVFLLLCLCILIVMYALFCIFCYHRVSWHSSGTLRFFRAFFLTCKANARENSQRWGTARIIPN